MRQSILLLSRALFTITWLLTWLMTCLVAQTFFTCHDSADQKGSFVYGKWLLLWAIAYRHHFSLISFNSAQVNNFRKIYMVLKFKCQLNLVPNLVPTDHQDGIRPFWSVFDDWQSYLPKKRLVSNSFCSYSNAIGLIPNFYTTQQLTDTFVDRISQIFYDDSHWLPFGNWSKCLEEKTTISDVT